MWRCGGTSGLNVFPFLREVARPLIFAIWAAQADLLAEILQSLKQSRPVLFTHFAHLVTGRKIWALCCENRRSEESSKEKEFWAPVGKLIFGSNELPLHCCQHDARRRRYARNEILLLCSDFYQKKCCRISACAQDHSAVKLKNVYTSKWATTSKLKSLHGV